MANDVIRYWTSHPEADGRPGFTWALSPVLICPKTGTHSGRDASIHRFPARIIRLGPTHAYAKLRSLADHAFLCRSWLRPDQKPVLNFHSWTGCIFGGDTVSPDFTSRYGLPTPLKVYQFINLALRNPVPPTQSGVTSCDLAPRSMAHRQFLLNAYNLFRGARRLGVANYAMIQSWTKNQQFTVNTMPWLLNALLASAKIRLKPAANGCAFENFPLGRISSKRKCALMGWSR